MGAGGRGQLDPDVALMLLSLVVLRRSSAPAARWSRHERARDAGCATSLLVVLTLLFVSPLRVHADHLVQDPGARPVQTPPTLVAEPVHARRPTSGSSAPPTPRCSAGSSTPCSPPRPTPRSWWSRAPWRPTPWPGWSSAGKKIVFGADRRDAVRAAGHPGHPQLRDRRPALLARHAAGDHRADGGQRLRGVLPAAVLPAAAAGAGGVGVPRRRQPLADLHRGSCCRCPSRRWPRWPCCRSSPTGTTSSGRSTCCSARRTRPCRPACPRCSPPTASRYDLLMAGAVVASVPVLLLYVFAQRFVIEGVSRSGLKG